MAKHNKVDILDRLLTPADLIDNQIEECLATITGIEANLKYQYRKIELLQQLKEDLYAAANAESAATANDDVTAPKKRIKVLVKRKTVQNSKTE